MSSADLPPQVSASAFTLDGRSPHQLKADVLALPVVPGPDAEGKFTGGLVVGPGADELDFPLLDVLEAEGASGKAGEVTSYPTPGGRFSRVLLVGLGAQRPDDFRRAGAALARAVTGADRVVTTIPALDPSGLDGFVAGATLGAFRLDWRSTVTAPAPAATIVLAELGEEQAGPLARAVAIATASWQARFLATVPSNLKNPAWVAAQATASGLPAKVWDEAKLAAEGFGGVLAVGGGSATPPRVVRLDYRASRKAPTVVLVGKGITFDTGGLDIKPAESMTTMKRDMTGSAVVLAVMSQLAAVGCPVNVVGLLMLAENAISGSSMRPGDVIRHYGGRTTEVTNTDAEGRLVLADGLAYAVAQIKPDVLIDVATLTGAVKVALGPSHGGLFATSDPLAAALESAGLESGENLWRLPLAGVYEEKLASKVADADNAAPGPGAITAALFLQHFTGGLPWAHLDLASVGDSAGDAVDWTPGPTGFGARLLLTWLSSPDPLAGI